MIATFLPFDRWHALAGALLLLAVVSIRNAWDITLTMVRRRSKADEPPALPFILRSEVSPQPASAAGRAALSASAGAPLAGLPRSCSR